MLNLTIEQTKTEIARLNEATRVHQESLVMLAKSVDLLGLEATIALLRKYSRELEHHHEVLKALREC